VRPESPGFGWGFFFRDVIALRARRNGSSDTNIVDAPDIARPEISGYGPEPKNSERLRKSAVTARTDLALGAATGTHTIPTRTCGEN
jgi:hypothetical protein